MYLRDCSALFYVANCGYPSVQQLNNTMEKNDGPLMVIGNTQDVPVMEGINVSFRCRSEFKLSGPNLSTCVRNGEWEPDPSEVKCRHRGVLYSSIIQCAYDSEMITS